MREFFKDGLLPDNALELLIEFYGSGALFADRLNVEAQKLFGSLEQAFKYYQDPHRLSIEDVKLAAIEYDQLFKTVPDVVALKRINEIEPKITKTAILKAQWAMDVATYTKRYFREDFEIAGECMKRIALWKFYCSTVK